MATRATYTIKSRLGVTSHLYIHWDGYLEGAAAYFYQALTSNVEGNGGFAECMIRANSGAELTSDFRQHSDTEFHYEIDADMTLRAYKWRYTDKGRELVPAFIGDIYSFINRYTECIEDFKPFKPVTRKFSSSCWMNELTAKRELESKSGPLHHLRIWSANNSTSRESANWKNCVEELKNIIDAFPELMTEEIAGFLA